MSEKKEQRSTSPPLELEVEMAKKASKTKGDKKENTNSRLVNENEAEVYKNDQKEKLGDYSKLIPKLVNLKKQYRNGHSFASWRAHDRSLYIGQMLFKYDKKSMGEACKGKSRFENRYEGQQKGLKKYEKFLQKNRQNEIINCIGTQMGCWCNLDNKKCHFKVLRQLTTEKMISLKKAKEENISGKRELNQNEKKGIEHMDTLLASELEFFDFQKEDNADSDGTASDVTTDEEI